jgi:hypothetical protein
VPCKGFKPRLRAREAAALPQQGRNEAGHRFCIRIPKVFLVLLLVALEHQHLKRSRNDFGENKGQGESQPGMITSQDVQEESPFFTLSSPTPVTWSIPVPPALPDDSHSIDSMGLM